MKKIIVITLFLMLLLSTLGCISDACGEVEKEMANQNITCKCSDSDTGNIFPEEAKNATEGEKCYCICLKDDLTIKAVTPKPSTSVSVNQSP